jgi:Tfp pilus assembly protein PilO
VTQVGTLISQFQSASKLQQTIGLAVPIGPNITQALNQWQAVAQANQANLQSLNVQPGQPAVASKVVQPLVKSLMRIPMEVEAIGNYASLKQFLSSIETNARVMNVDNFDFKIFSLNQPGGGTASPLYSIKLNVDAFYQAN